MSDNPFIRAAKKAKDEITDRGLVFDNTLELIDLRIDILLSDIVNKSYVNLDESEYELRHDYYGEEVYDKRLNSEMFHYNQLKYQMLHKVEELNYFHKSYLETRKNIIFSNDCISSVQYVKRGRVAYLIVHMRSSDIEALLPMDLLYLAKAFRAVTEYYTSTPSRVPYDEKVQIEIMAITIGSAHYYLSGGRD